MRFVDLSDRKKENIDTFSFIDRYSIYLDDDEDGVFHDSKQVFLLEVASLLDIY